MTTEEKADEICKRHIFDSNHYDCCMEMAEWKERQMIEKACDAYCRVCGHYPHTVPYDICRNDCDYYSDFRYLLKNLSKKAMKGGAK